MDAMETLRREIGAEIDALAEDDYGAVVIDGRCQRLAWRSLDRFKFPEPDVYLDPPAESLLRSRGEEEQINGAYIAMHSPGQVVLFRRNIQRTYWRLVCQLCRRVPYLTKGDLRAAAELVVMKTYHHELFHFYADVLRQLFGSTYDALLEEALAVAWARQVIIDARGTWNTKIGRMNGLFYRLLLDEAFSYQSPGYRDWPHYADPARFQSALVAYFDPPQHARLDGNGVDVGQMLASLLGTVSGGVVESVK
jgi:hypothetical protein